ncbi:MAG: GNAT family N-acetyltransferase [Planctomycetota bacterium]
MHAPAPPPKPEQSASGYTLRTFESGDQAAVLHLFDHGLLAGQVSPNDTGADIDNLADAYLSEPRNHFWVALDAQSLVVGMIGVAADDDHTAEIRRLRVQADLQGSSLPALLLETALNHCRKHGYLKVRLDTRFERCGALETFERIGFLHTRDRSAPGKEVLEFYADLYRQREDESGSGKSRETPEPTIRKTAGKLKVS